MAKVQTTTIEQVVVTKVPGYTLTLTKEEAMAVRAVCGSILGSSSDSPRKYTDDVYAVLSFAEVDDAYQDLGSGEIHFTKFNKGNNNGQ